MGRGRAWLYLALMQKKLADYLKVLIDNKHLLRYFITCLCLSFAKEFEHSSVVHFELKQGSIRYRAFIQIIV